MTDAEAMAHLFHPHVIKHVSKAVTAKGGKKKATTKR
jgi:hypothetical protein